MARVVRWAGRAAERQREDEALPPRLQILEEIASHAPTLSGGRSSPDLTFASIPRPRRGSGTRISWLLGATQGKLRYDPISLTPSCRPPPTAWRCYGNAAAFEGLKADPGKAGVDNLQAEIEKLTRIRAIWVGTGPFANVPWKVLQMLKRRASKETASEMRDHSNLIRYALMASYLYVRAMETSRDFLRIRAHARSAPARH